MIAFNRISHRRPKLPVKAVLTYHSISDSPLSVSVEIFKHQMSYLYGNSDVDIVPLSEIYNHPRNCVAITFDDCFLDTYVNAVPILLKYHFPATFFAVPGYDNKVLWGSIKHQRWSPEFSKDFTIPFEFFTPQIRKELNALGFEIGAHSMSHRNLDTLNEVSQREEILGSIRFLERELGSKVRSFCFPRGRFNETSLQILRESSTVQWCTTQKGYVHNSNLVNRFSAPSNLYVFKAIINGQGSELSFIERIKARLGI